MLVRIAVFSDNFLWVGDDVCRVQGSSDCVLCVAASRSGLLKVGDKVLQVNGKDVGGLSASEAMMLISGEPESTVLLKLGRAADLVL